MRKAFIESLIHEAAVDERIHLLVGDLGFGLVEPFAAKYPNRFLNVGVAEQNLIGVAAGMALCGKTVFAYSIANFPTLRCVEHIRNDVCHHDAAVIVVSAGTGLGYGALGVTHHATEDIATLRSLPGITILSPADAHEARVTTSLIASRRAPAYLRLGRTGDPLVHGEGTPVTIGKAIKVTDGQDVTIIATGSMVHTATVVASMLVASKLTARVLSMHTLKPLDANAVLDAVAETRAIVTLEEHSIMGGLGTAVAEVLAESSAARVPFKRLGVAPVFTSPVGNYDYLRKVHRLTPDLIANDIVKHLEGARLPPGRQAAAHSP